MSVYPRKDGVYVFDFWRRGIRFYGVTGCTQERAARQFERTEKDKAAAQEAAIKEQRSAPLRVSVAFHRFWSDVGQHYRGTWRQTVWTALAWLEDRLGRDTLLADIDDDHIRALVAERRGEGVAPATVNRTVTELLRTLLRRARRHWKQHGLPDIVWADLLLAEPRERVRELRDHEEEKLDGAMRADYLPAIKFAVVSGLRKRELVNLRWTDIDWTAGIVTVLGKGDKVRLVPLTTEMRAMLAPLRGQHDDYVFTYVALATRRKAGTPWRLRGRRYPITYSGLSTAWRRHGGEKAGVPDFRIHDLRHTTGTRLLRASGNLKLVQQLLGHEQIATTTRYAHADDHDLREAMERLGRKRRQISRFNTDLLIS